MIAIERCDHCVDRRERGGGRAIGIDMPMRADEPQDRKQRVVLPLGQAPAMRERVAPVPNGLAQRVHEPRLAEPSLADDEPRYTVRRRLAAHRATMAPLRFPPRVQQRVELARAADHRRTHAGVERIERRIGVPLAEQLVNRLRREARPRQPQRGRPEIGMPFEREPRIVADQNLSGPGQPQQSRRRGRRRAARHVRRMRERLPDVDRGRHFDPPAVSCRGNAAAGSRRHRQPRAPGYPHDVERRTHRAALRPVDIALQAEMEQQRVAEPSACVRAVTDGDIGALRQPLLLVAVERISVLRAGMALPPLSGDRHATAQRGDLSELAERGDRLAMRRKRTRRHLPARATGIELPDERSEVERAKLRRERIGRRGALLRILVQCVA